MKMGSAYEAAIYGQDSLNIEDYYGPVVKSVAEIPKAVRHVTKSLGAQSEEKGDEQEYLVKKIENFHRTMGLLTPRVRERLGAWFQAPGRIEAGHQPLYFGGGIFVINKIVFTAVLSDVLKDELPLTPIFIIGDHDEVQNELTIARFPQSLGSGLELKARFDPKDGQVPMHLFPLPPELDFESQIDKIRQNYRDLLRYSKIRPEFRLLLDERLESAIGVVEESYYKSGGSFSKWIANIWGNLVILKNNSSITMISSSDPGFRELLLPYLENLLKEDNRSRFINAVNEFHRKITENNIDPAIPLREKDYVPFFLECKNKDRQRIRLSTNGSTLSGDCSLCSERYQISYEPDKPDLHEFAQNLSPRVDSRTIAVSELIDSRVRVTGGGETSYFAQLNPAIRSIGRHVPPLVIKQPRMYYNTPWGEKLSSEVREKYSTLKLLHEKENFKRIGLLSRSQDSETFRNLVLETKKDISSAYGKLLSETKRIREIPGFEKNSKLRQDVQIIEQYVTVNWGRYSPEKTYQDVAWNWIDFSIVAGLYDVTGALRRITSKNSSPAATFWVSLGQYS